MIAHTYSYIMRKKIKKKDTSKKEEDGLPCLLI